MNKIVTLIIVLFIAFGCKTVQTTKLTKVETINQLLNQWHKDAAVANFESYFNVMSDDGYYIGTDSSEIWTKKEFQKYAKPHFDKKKTWDFKTIKRTIFFSKNHKTAWFNELLDTWMGTCRGSGVLELQNNQWKIKQYVLSVTIPNDKMKKVIKVK